MKEVKFDFNNLFDFSLGPDQGVSETQLKELLPALQAAQKHLTGLINSPRNSVKLGLEWAQLPFQNKKTLKEIQGLGNQIAKDYENVIFLGIGGSYLGLKAAQDALRPPYYNEFSALRNNRPRIYFGGNNLDPDTLASLLKNLNPKKTFVVVISKSGETTETKAAFMVVVDWLERRVGKNFGWQIAAITDPESGSLRQTVNAAHKKDKLAFRSLPLLKGVGGRFSELNMGLLHLAVLGIDIQEVLDGAASMAKRCQASDVFGNPAYMYAALHTILYRQKGKSIAIMMPFSETLKSTADWYVQLLAESLGKKFARKIAVNQDQAEEWASDKENILNVGRTPVSSRGTNDLHSIQQNNIEGENNKVVTFIRVEQFRDKINVPSGRDILSGKNFAQLLALAQEATEWALTRESRPNCTIILPKVSPYYWGGLIFFLEMATAFEGELLNINAFDQPGVEGYKNYMYYKLGKPGISEEVAGEIKNNPLTKNAKFIL